MFDDVYHTQWVENTFCLFKRRWKMVQVIFAEKRESFLAKIMNG